MLGFVKFLGICLTFFLLGGGITASGDASATSDNKDVAATVICNVVVFVQRLGLPIMTGVILGASIMAIFGKMAWASIVVLVVFTAIFFGAGKLIQKFAAGLTGDGAFKDASQFECKSGGIDESK